MRVAAVFVVSISSLLAGCTHAGDEGDEPSACFGEGELGPLALRVDMDRAWLIEGSRTIELDLVGPGTTTVVRAAAEGSLVGVAQNSDIGTTLHGFDRAGALLWSQSFADVASTGLWAGPEGLAASTTELLGGGPVGLVASEAGGLSLAAHVPLGGPAQGQVPVVELMGDSVFGQPGWIALADSSFTPVTLAPIDPYAVVVGDDGRTLEYASLDGSTLVYAQAQPSGTAKIALPAPFVDKAYLVAAAGEFRLVRADASPEVFARVDLDAGQARAIEPTPPPGWDWFDCAGRGAAIDRDGRVLFELRSTTAAAVWAYDLDTDAWSELGLPMSGVEDLEFVAGAGDVHVVRGIASGFCPDVVWPEAPPADALLGASLQVLRREPALALELPGASGDASIDAGQRCVAYEAGQAWQVRALDEDASLSFDPGGTWIWVD